MTDAAAVPAPLRAYGWRDDAPAGVAFAAAGGGRVARVTEQHRSGYIVTDGARDFAAQSPAAWIRAGFDPVERAAVGDWVRLDADVDQILDLLPRSSLFKRGAAGEHQKTQPIAANVDTVFVVTGLDNDFNPRRLERYLVLIHGSGASPVVVLTKADRSDAVDALRAQLAQIEQGGVPIHAVNAKDAASVAQLHGYLAPGRTVVLVGSSGAGKSTLTNTLLGREKMKTNAVRGHDSRGRHTTTHRALLPLPQGACLIDTPGMRELKLTGDEDTVDAVFDDIDALAALCRFRDCKHDREPGCAVRAALEAGTLDPARWANYAKLQGELATAADAVAAQQARKGEARVQNKALQKRLDEKYGKR
ncbi:ribosome small subunit-dependent GTPase A [Chiayiivirga flava]|uniref:Small ribosomal subunit biogenesis GTPase RsgA n=1 Tax=Chiayiivirga flava TaxID=659595 RepID=A0A7W8G305_9GAMM|nr:ribosome small subunit-dependent GTPase A [Chiayiivirga flava]MBB5209225.1 ribosome biogenesis GTPase [Chiayiivirga flava]